jgi:hypothetical protein
LPAAFTANHAEVFRQAGEYGSCSSPMSSKEGWRNTAMRLLTGALFTLGTAAVLYAGPANACTNPESGAGDPTVTGKTGGDSPTGSTTPGGAPLEESTPGAATPTSGEVALDSSFVEVAWSPAKEVDGDPNNTAFYSHTGHRIGTRVQVRDASTQKVVLEETVPQYDYANAVKGGSNPAVSNYFTRLEPGRYEIRVQSVFSRHDEVRYGLDGVWRKVSTVSSPPALAATVPAAKIVIPAGVDMGGEVAGGCSSTGSGPGGWLLGGALWALALVLAARRRGSA